MKWLTDTPDWSDSAFDSTVSDALRSVVVTTQHKQRAWERLRTRASEQPMLPPLRPGTQAAFSAEPSAHAPRPVAARILGWWLSILFDDTRYDRALRQRYTCLSFSVFDNPLRNALGGVAR